MYNYFKMEIVVKPRKWGNSVGISIPKEVVEEEGIELDKELVIEIKGANKSEKIKSLFGKFKFDKSTQEIKDEMKKGW